MGFKSHLRVFGLFFLCFIYSLSCSYSRLLSHEEDSQLRGGTGSGQDKREDATTQRWPAARWHSNQHKRPQQERHWRIDTGRTSLTGLSPSPRPFRLPHAHPFPLLKLSVRLLLAHNRAEQQLLWQINEIEGAPERGCFVPAVQKKKLRLTEWWNSLWNIQSYLLTVVYNRYNV